MPRLVVFSGLPGTGKSTIARELARQLRAVWLRIDTIETAIADEATPITDEGYRAACALAVDNLRLGLDVVGDSVNPWMKTRDSWRDAGLAAGADVLEIEVVCSDPAEHRRRVETRTVDVPGLTPPIWEEVVGRDYRPWTRDRLVVDTARRSVAACVAEILARL
ncbi:MAG: AAA family ATPase [Phenylobacterium sp.]|uniref:AAA family ATPase n=1 Tax=Phenylobacterium sp. TaxID=1871053 RepID=UPI001206C60C|nr:AAA family ATPase [Phenylobacterium sp.]TAL33352.1 MAG: AAA family ATPase [Phenylobacterium sp.]